jgi:hypothetical protein
VSTHWHILLKQINNNKNELKSIKKKERKKIKKIISKNNISKSQLLLLDQNSQTYNPPRTSPPSSILVPVHQDDIWIYGISNNHKVL